MTRRMGCVDTVSDEDSKRATAVLGILRSDGDAIVLSGSRHVPPDVLLCAPLSIRRGGLENRFLARVSYHLQPRLAGGVVLTCRKEAFAEIRDERVATLARLGRRAGINFMVECAFSLGHRQELAVGRFDVQRADGVVLLRPSDGELDELIRLLRLHETWPVSVESLAEEFSCERWFWILSSKPDSIIIHYADSRHAPPSFFENRLFWSGPCRLVAVWPDPGVRRVPVIELRTLREGCLVMAVRPGRASLFSFLNAHLHVMLRAAFVSARPAGSRRRVHSLVLSPMATRKR